MVLITQGKPDFVDPDETALLRRRCAELEARLADVDVIKRFAGTMLRTHSDEVQILWELATEAIASLGLEDCVIYLREGEWLHQRAAFGPKNPRGQEILAPIRIQVGSGIVGTAAATGKVQRVDDTRLDPRYILDDEARLSELAMPILVDGEVIGVLDSEHASPGFYTDWHVDLFETLASLAASRIARARLEREREQLLSIDELTGLLNRREFTRRLQETLDSGPLALIFIELQDFSQINTSYGLAAGDAALREIGTRVAAEVGSQGLACRMVGDRFVLATMPYGAFERARRLRDAISAPVTLGDARGTSVRPFVGIALEQAGRVEDLLHDGYLALERAREEESSQIAIFDDELAQQRKQRWEAGRALAAALDNDSRGIEILFQPIFAMPGQRVVAAQAVARWRHPELGEITSADLLTVAEQAGLLDRLSVRLFNLALQAMKGWQLQSPDLQFHFSFSATELATPQFAESVLALVRQSGVQARTLVVEVTEAMVLAGERNLRINLERLRQGGLGLALLYGGAGFAALGTLSSYPFTAIKIDRALTRNCASRAKDAAIIHALVSLATAMDLAVMGEGVESGEQAQALLALGCPRAQGDGLGPPQSEADFSALLSNHRGR